MKSLTRLMYRTCLIRKKKYNIENSLLKNLVVGRPRSVNSMVEQVKLKIKKSHGLVDNSKFIRKILMWIVDIQNLLQALLNLPK